MPTSVDIKNLKINKLTEAQYDTAVQGGVIGENELSVLTDVELEQIQVSALPTASADELGKIYQYIGATDSTYTNGYFYKCVSDGQSPATYSWESVEVQASSGGLPDQTGQSGKFLTTDGSSASWSDKPLVNNTTGSNSVSILGLNRPVSSNMIAIGKYAGDNGQSYSIMIGYSTSSRAQYGIAIGNTARVGIDASYAIQLGSGDNNVNNDANTFKVANANGNFEIMSANGTIPADRLVNAINKYSTMPTASADNLGWIVQFTGTTDSTYTHGHLYECVSDGADPATYSWTEVSMGGGGSSYTAGTGIDITSGVISVASPTLTNTATGSNSLTVLGTATSTNQNSINIGKGSSINSQGAYDKKATVIGVNSSGDQDTVVIGYGTTGNLSSVVIGSSASGGTNNVIIGYNASGSTNSITCIGKDASCSGLAATAIGQSSHANAQEAIQIGVGTNSTANTLSVGLSSTNNYRLLSSDGTIPTARLTKVNTTITLTSAGWSSNTQTVNVTGMTATGVVFPSPDPADQSAYTGAGILCTAQGSGTLTFTCTSVPSADITVNVVML